MNPLAPADLYHTGVMVRDLDEAKARMTAVGGYRWTTLQTGELPVRMGDEVKVLQFEFLYSLEPPHIELVREIPGTPWTGSAHMATHHLGYFCDDVAATCERLDALGFHREAVAEVDGQPGLFAFLRDRFGVRIEVVERSLMPDWPQFLRDNAAS